MSYQVGNDGVIHICEGAVSLCGAAIVERTSSLLVTRLCAVCDRVERAEDCGGCNLSGCIFCDEDA